MIGPDAEFPAPRPDGDGIEDQSSSVEPVRQAPSSQSESTGDPDGESASSNPLADQLDFSLSVPTIEVRMVNAAALEEYEIWFLGSSLLSSVAIGFLVAYFQSFHENDEGVQVSDGSSLVVAIIFFAFLGFSLWRALQLRRRITSESKTYKMKASAATIVPEAEED